MNLRLILTMAAGASPDRIALGHTTDGVTFADLDSRASATSRLVEQLDGSALIFIGVNSVVVPQLLFGAAGAGVPFAPLNYRLSIDAMNKQIARIESPVVIADPAIAPELSGRNVRGVFTTEQWTDLVAQQERSGMVGQDASDADGAAIYLFTSGTTAEPKCVVLRHSHLASYVLGTVEFASAAADDCALSSVPPYHIAGMGATLTNIYAGRRVVYLPDFSPNRWLDLVRDQSVTQAMLVPTMLARIIDHLDGAPAECPNLRSLAYGGARMPIPVLLHALDAFPETDFVNAYGLTETSSTIAVLGPDEHRNAVTEGRTDRLGSVGTIVPGLEAEIRDTDGNIIPVGHSGELWVRGAQVSGEYAGLGSVLDENGWFPTRDRAHLDDSGYLYLEGRSDDTIIRGAENISPAEIEDVLLNHPAVREAAVIGLPDTDWGERIVAVIVCNDAITATEDELRHYVRQRLRGSRTPDAVVFRTELPYTPTGKLLRRELVAEIGIAASS